MIVNTKFDMLQEIYVIKEGLFYSNRASSCFYCDGQGELEFKNGGKHPCCRCFTTGYEQIIKPEGWQIIGKFRVTSMDIYFNINHLGPDPFYEDYCYKLELGSPLDNSRQYIEINGEKENNFTTEQEAQEECDKRNAKLKFCKKCKFFHPYMRFNDGFFNVCIIGDKKPESYLTANFKNIVVANSAPVNYDPENIIPQNCLYGMERALLNE